MKFRARVLLIVMWVVILLPQLGYAQERIASWNIQHLGWNNGKDFAALGVVGSHFDFIAVQEVMNEEGIERFRRALEGATGAEWLKTCSHLVGRGSYREMYCFTWRTDRFVLEGGEAVFIDSRDVFAREPFSAVFQSASGFRFVATSIHAIYRNSVAQRQAEAQALRGYYDWLSEAFPDLPILLMGDFNLAPTNPAWTPLGAAMYPLIQEGATTISTIDGRFANLYDNIWVPAGAELPILDFGRLEFPHRVLGITHEEARAHVSDHIPVWVKIDGRVQGRAFPPHTVGRGQVAASPEAAPGKTPEAGSPIIGNRNSHIYHLPNCPSYSRVAERNRVTFGSEAEARAAGFRKAGNC